MDNRNFEPLEDQADRTLNPVRFGGSVQEGVMAWRYGALLCGILFRALRLAKVGESVRGWRESLGGFVTWGAGGAGGVRKGDSDREGKAAGGRAA